MDFSPHQDAALTAVDAWLKSKPGRNSSPQVFRLFGYAGTGKTTLARHIADGVDGKVLYAAFTGKAASVMRSKGCTGASTIHSLIYKPRESGEEIPSFDLWDEAPASKAKLIVIDECSMVYPELGRDLLDCGASRSMHSRIPRGARSGGYLYPATSPPPPRRRTEEGRHMRVGLLSDTHIPVAPILYPEILDALRGVAVGNRRGGLSAHHDLAVGAEHEVGGLGVVEDVGLCRGRGVARHEGVAAHEHDRGDEVR